MNRNDILPLLSTLERGCKFGSPESKKQLEDYQQIREKLRLMNEGELFYGLYFLAVQDEFQTPAGFAASLLRDLSPTCQISCEEAIRVLMAGEWNVSTRALPFYLVEQFGKESVKNAIQQVRVGSLAEMEIAYLDTIEYWVRLADE